MDHKGPNGPDRGDAVHAMSGRGSLVDEGASSGEMNSFQVGGRFFDKEISGLM